MHIFAHALALALLLLTLLSSPASAASPPEDDPEDMVPKEMVMLPGYTFIRTDWSQGPTRTAPPAAAAPFSAAAAAAAPSSVAAAAPPSAAAATPRSASPFGGPSGFSTIGKRQEGFVETTVREFQMTISTSQWDFFDPVTVTVTETPSSSLVDVPRISSPPPPPTVFAFPPAHMSMSSFSGKIVSSSASGFISSSAGVYVSSTEVLYVSSSGIVVESSAVGIPGFSSAAWPGTSVAAAHKPSPTKTTRASTSSRPPAPTVNAPQAGIKDKVEPVTKYITVEVPAPTSVIVNPSKLDLPANLGAKQAPDPAAVAPAKPKTRLPKNRQEYLERNYNWIRCRTLHTPHFDVGGGWVDDGGKRLWAGMGKWIPQCVPVNNRVTYVNGQDWGDATLFFDCFFPWNNIKTIVKALEKIGHDYAVDHRREFYIFNCPGFNSGPYAGIEPKKGP